MSHTRNIRSMLAGAGVLAALGAIPAAAIANDAAPERAPLVLAQAAEIDDETIEAFAEAQVRVEEIRNSYMPQYQAAETDEERQQLSEAATQEMVEAVRDTPNLTVEEYDAVIRAANEDPSIAERINEAMADGST